MIRVDPDKHLQNISFIIQTRYLTYLVFALALGVFYIPILTSLFYFVIGLFVFVFPFYLLFALIINQKNRWAAGLVICMVCSFLPSLLNVEIIYLSFLFSYLPVLTIIIYCIMLNSRLKEWGYE